MLYFNNWMLLKIECSDCLNQYSLYFDQFEWSDCHNWTSSYKLCPMSYDDYYFQEKSCGDYYYLALNYDYYSRKDIQVAKKDHADKRYHYDDGKEI